MIEISINNSGWTQISTGRVKFQIVEGDYIKVAIRNSAPTLENEPCFIMRRYEIYDHTDNSKGVWARVMKTADHSIRPVAKIVKI
jgi:hypothetical protein